MTGQNKQIRTQLLLILATLASTGCGINPGRRSFSAVKPAADEIIRAQNCDCTDGCDSSCSPRGFDSQIERGTPNKFVDGFGWFMGIPEKVLLWDRRVENHNISLVTEDEVRNYLSANELSNVKVRLNQYAPGSEWRRLRDNKAVAPGWRYTVGALSVLGYTILPGRIFGGDSYNPFTDTVSLYSDVPAIAVHEAAYARDNASRTYRGTYGFFQHVDIVNTMHETNATKNALQYYDTQKTLASKEEAKRILHPLYGARVGSSIGGVIPDGQGLATIGGALIGHATGRIQ